MRLVKLLYVESDENCARLFHAALPLDMQEGQNQYFVDTAKTPDVARALIRFTSYDAIFVDSQLNYDGDSSTSFLQELTENGFQNPLVLLTPELDPPALDAKTRQLIESQRIVPLPKAELHEDNIKDFVEFVLGRSIRLLHVEDDDDDALMIEDLLHEAAPICFTVKRAATIDEARDLLAEDVWDVLLLDWRLVGPRGSETSEPLIRELVDQGVDISMLLLSGQDVRFLSEHLARLIGRRRIAYCSKEQVSTARLVNTIMSQRNGSLQQYSVVNQ